MGRGVDMPWVGAVDQNTMGRGVNIPWIGVRYTMGRGGGDIKFQNFHRISQLLTNFIRFQKFQKKIQNFHKNFKICIS
jgi:hypothetical protein